MTRIPPRTFLKIIFIGAFAALVVLAMPRLKAAELPPCEPSLTDICVNWRLAASTAAGKPLLPRSIARTEVYFSDRPITEDNRTSAKKLVAFKDATALRTTAGYLLSPESAEPGDLIRIYVRARHVHLSGLPGPMSVEKSQMVSIAPLPTGPEVTPLPSLIITGAPVIHTFRVPDELPAVQ